MQKPQLLHGIFSELFLLLGHYLFLSLTQKLCFSTGTPQMQKPQLLHPECSILLLNLIQKLFVFH